jgi:AbrB family looped-hinge helix DNA binding protein
VTIPVEIRRLLGIRPGDKIAFIATDDQVTLRRGENVVDRTKGIFKHSGPVLTAEELREAAEIAIAEEAQKRSGG